MPRTSSSTGGRRRGRPKPDGSYRSLSTMEAGDFFGEIAALTGSRRTATVVAEEPTTIVEVPAAALRALMTVPELGSLFLSKLTERLSRTNTADLPRFSGVDQASLKDLRTPRPSAEALPKSLRVADRSVDRSGAIGRGPCAAVDRLCVASGIGRRGRRLLCVARQQGGPDCTGARRGVDPGG